jgi:tetratricopeptide (TPR) repeat protein
MATPAWIPAILLLLLAGCGPVRPPLTRQPVSPATAAAVQAAVDRGIAALEARHPESASGCFREALALDPGSDLAQAYLGLALVRGRQLDAAAEAFERLLTLVPEQPQAHSNLGAVYLMQHRHRKARATLLKAIALDPELPAPYFCLGSLLLAMGDPGPGAGYLAKGMALDPGYLARHSEAMESVVVAGGRNPEGFLAYARVSASFGDAERTVSYLEAARKAGFRDWRRLQDKSFDPVRGDPRIQALIQGSQ